MLFNSFEFLFLFLPLAVAGHFAAARLGGERTAMAWLTAVSVGFYAWWRIEYVPLLGLLAVFSFLVGRRLAARPSRGLLAVGVGVLLGVLGYYKYAGFLDANIAALTGRSLGVGAVVLPLAISFFTFQKIAFLVDSQKGLTRGVRFGDYLLFVTFFPQLIAGPIVHWRELVPQFGDRAVFRPRAENFAVGLTIFAIGLFKKAVLADGVAAFASPTFAAAANGAEPELFAAWAAALAYTFQIYFDFSGYSDMAIGAARLFGIKLPLNFASPYKATNIIEFWRRWHMTLSRFLRDYLYIALGGNRRGRARRYANLFLTMLLGGLWHGAGWQFLLWGALHGAYLMIAHACRAVVPARVLAGAPWRGFAWGATFLAVVLAWIPFRAADLGTAGRVLAGMAGTHGATLPEPLGGALAPLAALGVAFEGGLGGFALGWAWIAVTGAIALLAPNTQQIMARFAPALDAAAAPGMLAWKPDIRWAVGAGVVAALGVLALTSVSEFLYFQF